MFDTMSLGDGMDKGKIKIAKNYLNYPLKGTKLIYYFFEVEYFNKIPYSLLLSFFPFNLCAPNIGKEILCLAYKDKQSFWRCMGHSNCPSTATNTRQMKGEYMSLDCD